MQTPGTILAKSPACSDPSTLAAATQEAIKPQDQLNNEILPHPKPLANHGNVGIARGRPPSKPHDLSLSS